MGKHWARSIQPKFQPVRPGKVVHLKKWTLFFETFPVEPNRSIEFWTEILVEWITPTNVLVSNIIIVISINQIVSPAYTNLAAIEESGSKKHL